MSFVFMPMPMGGPFGMMNQQREQQVQSHASDFPMRVEKAMEFLQHLNTITATRIAVTEHQVHEVEGRALSDEERDVRDSALMVVRQYFEGKLKPDMWELLRYDLHSSKIQAATAIQKAASAVQSAGGKVMDCPQCPRPGNAGCHFCSGTAKIVVTPLAGVPTEQITDTSSPPEATAVDVREGAATIAETIVAALEAEEDEGGDDDEPPVEEPMGLS